MSKPETTPLQQACIELNQAIDSYWMSTKGFRLTGMAEVFVKEITAAQQKCKTALEGEGLPQGSNP
jgi:hypothetical protein